jgi:hypothetical protein
MMLFCQLVLSITHLTWTLEVYIFAYKPNQSANTQQLFMCRVTSSGSYLMFAELYFLASDCKGETLELLVKSPCLWACFHPHTLFQWYLQSKEILFNYSMECWNSTFIAQGSGVIIIVVHVGEVNIYVPAVEALRQKERQDETQFTSNIAWKTSLGLSYYNL